MSERSKCPFRRAYMTQKSNAKQLGVITPQGYFVTTKAASEALGIPKPTVEWRARNNKFGFSQPAIA